MSERRAESQEYDDKYRSFSFFFFCYIFFLIVWYVHILLYIYRMCVGVCINRNAM